MGPDFIKIRRGDTSAFRQFFNDFYPALCFFINKILQDEEAAHDIAQEAFICFWNKNKETPLNHMQDGNSISHNPLSK